MYETASSSLPTTLPTAKLATMLASMAAAAALAMMAATVMSSTAASIASSKGLTSKFNCWKTEGSTSEAKTGKRIVSPLGILSSNVHSKTSPPAT